VRYSENALRGKPCGHLFPQRDCCLSQTATHRLWHFVGNEFLSLSQTESAAEASSNLIHHFAYFAELFDVYLFSSILSIAAHATDAQLSSSVFHMESTSDAAFTLDFIIYDDKKVSILPTPKGTR
jgi:hypothetical protein